MLISSEILVTSTQFLVSILVNRASILGGNWRAACKKPVSDFLGQIFFPRPNELNFGMWPATS